MKTVLFTLLKIALVVAIAWVVYHLFPVLAAPLVAIGLAILAIGGVVSGGMLVVGLICLAVFAVVGVAFLILVGLLSPVWLPVLALIGLVSLLRSGSKKAA